VEPPGGMLVHDEESARHRPLVGDCPGRFRGALERAFGPVLCKRIWLGRRHHRKNAAECGRRKEELVDTENYTEMKDPPRDA
jgi:hypothetical protein